MKFIKILLFFLTFPLLSGTSLHKFYVSTTNIEYVQEEQAIQIITKIFVDDLEQALSKRYATKIHLETGKETLQDEEYLKKYIFQKLKIDVNGQENSVKYVGKEYDIDIINVYLEIESVSELKSLQIENTILMDMYEQQQNIIHFKSKNVKRSWVFDKDTLNGMLNLN